MEYVAVGNFETCLCQANGFLATAEFCVKDLLDMSDEMKAPFVTNISFSCELYLKAIMIHESGNSTFYKGHDLKDLFYKLSSKTQKIIREAYEKRAIHSIHGATLDAFLDLCRKDFEKWRYAFENDSLEANASDYMNFAYRLQECVKELKEIS